MKTKHRNTGTNDGSGRWEFESFAFDDGTCGTFIVEYTPKWTSFKHEPEHSRGWEFEALNPTVARDEWTMTDEFHDVVRRISDQTWEWIEKQILEAFEDQLEDVEIAEREYR